MQLLSFCRKNLSSAVTLRLHLTLENEVQFVLVPQIWWGGWVLGRRPPPSQMPTWTESLGKLYSRKNCQLQVDHIKKTYLMLFTYPVKVFVKLFSLISFPIVAHTSTVVKWTPKWNNLSCALWSLSIWRIFTKVMENVYCEKNKNVYGFHFFFLKIQTLISFS